jgi:MinD-like ATPase involved in chromosome partitioning or flagellar assembly
MRARAELTRAPRVFAFASGKGGTGKSILAAAVACAAARAGLRVVLVDCDFGKPNAHLRLGVEPEKGRFALDRLFDGEGGRRPAALGRLAEPVAGFFGKGSLALVSGAAAPEAADLHEARRAKLVREIARIEADLVILDLSAGTSRRTIETLLGRRGPGLPPLPLSIVLVVTPDDPASIVDAAQLVKALAARLIFEAEPPLVPDEPIEARLGRLRARDPACAETIVREIARRPVHFLFNRVRSESPRVLEAKARALSRFLEQRIGVRARWLGAVPESEEVRRASSGPEPLFSRFLRGGNIERLFLAIAKALLEDRSDAVAEKPPALSLSDLEAMLRLREAETA